MFWPTPPHYNRNPFLSKAVRPTAAGCRLQAVRPLWTHQLRVASLRFLGKCYSININASSLWRKGTSHQTTYPWKYYDSIPYTTTLVTFETRLLEIWDNNVFIADHSFRKMVISTSQLHYFMLLCRTESWYKRQFGSNSLLFTAFKKLSSSTLALERERTPSLHINVSEHFFDTIVGPRPNLARMCG